MMDLKYTEILRLNNDLGNSLRGDRYCVTVLSNIITNQFNEIFEYVLRSEGINAAVTSGDYDNIVQDAIKYNKSDLVIIFWELANLIDGLQYKANLMDSESTEALISKVCSEIDFTISNLENASLVVFNKFSSIVFNHTNLRSNNFDVICNKLNNYLEQRKGNNFVLIDIEKIFAKISVTRSVDFRYYYSSKALYTIEFYKSYSQFIAPIIKSVKGKAKKALIFDCDNTLWKGILGEDGAEKIEISGKTKSGVVFEEVQNIALELSRKGVLIGLCSKNNPQDVDIILNEHPDMSIRNNNIGIKKVNWEDKATNLKAISTELNIGLDSLVFIDDSEFETGYIKDILPQVTVLKVPTNLYEYPQLIRSNHSLFFNVSQTREDDIKTEMYLQQAKRAEGKNAFNDIESYLISLSLEVTVYQNVSDLIPRISQLTQKTNQFNLTTFRYTEADINSFITDGNTLVLAFDVKDKYGDSGITGVCIVNMEYENASADIDSMLMSCRVIGRNIEIAFFNFLINHLLNLGINELRAKYIKTFKNEQVNLFYDSLGFQCVNESNDFKDYVLQLNNYKRKEIDYIKINYGKEN